MAGKASCNLKPTVLDSNCQKYKIIQIITYMYMYTVMALQGYVNLLLSKFQ